MPWSSRLRPRRQAGSRGLPGCIRQRGRRFVAGPLARVPPRDPDRPLWVGPPSEEPPSEALAVVIDPGRALRTVAPLGARLALERFLLDERRSCAAPTSGCGLRRPCLDRHRAWASKPGSGRGRRGRGRHRSRSARTRPRTAPSRSRHGASTQPPPAGSPWRTSRSTGGETGRRGLTWPRRRHRHRRRPPPPGAPPPSSARAGWLGTVLLRQASSSTRRPRPEPAYSSSSSEDTVRLPLPAARAAGAGAAPASRTYPSRSATARLGAFAGSTWISVRMTHSARRRPRQRARGLGREPWRTRLARIQ